MSIVIDIGCARYGGDYSIERLIDEFHPDVLYGFDPNPAIREFRADEETRKGDTAIILSQQAAWTYDGDIGYLSEGLNSCLTNREDAQKVLCFDLADFIRSLAPDGEIPKIVLKVDAEGSEYELLEHLIAKGVDSWLTLAWIEWHPFGVEHPDRRRRQIEQKIACEITEWRW